MEKANKEILNVFDLIDLLSIQDDHSMPVRLAKKDEFPAIFEREFKKSKADDEQSFSKTLTKIIDNHLQLFWESGAQSYATDIDSKAREFKGYLELNVKTKGTHSPTIRFSDALQYVNKEKLIDFLKSEFPEGKNSQAAIMTFALIKNELLNEPENLSGFAFSIMDEWKVSCNPNQRPESFLKKFRKLNAKNAKLTAETTAAINKIKNFITE